MESQLATRGCCVCCDGPTLLANEEEKATETRTRNYRLDCWLGQIIPLLPSYKSIDCETSLW